MNLRLIARRLVDLAREPSTYRGLVWLLTAAGISLSPDLVAEITAAGAGLAGLIGFLMKD